MPSVGFAITFTRGDQNLASFDHLWSNLNNWASLDRSSGTANPNGQNWDADGWTSTHPSNVLTGIGTMYLAPNSSYVGDDAPSLDIEGYILLDANASINKIYTSEYYNANYDSTNMAYGISDAKTWDAAGNITERYDTTLTIRCVTSGQTYTTFDAVTTSFASRAFTFDVDLELKSAYVAAEATSYSTGINMISNAMHDTIYTDGHTMSVVANATSGALSHLVFKLGLSTSEPTGTVYLNSKVVLGAGRSLTFLPQSDANAKNYDYKIQKVVIGGSQSNEVYDIRLNPRTEVTFAKTGGAMVINKEKHNQTYVRMYSDTTLNYGASNQVQLTRFYVIHNNNNYQRNGWTINLNGYSQGFDEDGNGLIECLNFYTSATLNDGARADLNLDFGVNNAIQEFYVGIFKLEGTYFDVAKQSIVLKNYVLGEDHFLMGEDISSNATAMAIFDFEGYDMNIYEVVCEYNDFYQSYEVTLAAIPEPSTVAAIFGVAALAFAAYRRKK